jgi:hypothetical protein
MTVALVQADVQVCFGVGIRLIDKIPLWITGSRRWRQYIVFLCATHEAEPE